MTIKSPNFFPIRFTRFFIFLTGIAGNKNVQHGVVPFRRMPASDVKYSCLWLALLNHAFKYTKLLAVWQIFFLLIYDNNTFAQSHLQNLRNKTSGQISNASNGVFMDSSFFKARIGVNVRDLRDAAEERGLTPYDFTSLQAAKDTASSRLRPLIVPWNYTASTLTFKAADSALVLICYGTINITAADTIPAGAQVIMRRSGRFNLSSGASTFRIEGEFDGGTKRRFIGDGAGNVRLLNAREIRPEWWGAKNDSTGEWATAFQNAFNAGIARQNVVSLIGGGRGYIINSTVRFPQGATGREIYLRGNGATIWSSGSDTLLSINNISNSSSGFKYPRHLIEDIWFKRISGNLDNGVAIVVNNSVEQTIRRCYFQDYKNAIVLMNTLQTVAGWTEGLLVNDSRFAGCDTSIAFKGIAGGLGSFANTKLDHLSINADATGRSKWVVGIYINTNARVYSSNFSHVYLAINDSATGLYSDGKLDGTYGNLRIEGFGSCTPCVGSRAIELGPNATNTHVNIFVGIEGINHMEHVIKSAVPSSRQYNGFTFQFLGDGATTNRGITSLYQLGNTTRLHSVLPADSIAPAVTGSTTGVPPPSAFTYNFDISSTGSVLQRFRRTNIPEFIDTENAYLQPVRLLDIGRRRTNVNDSSSVDVRNYTHVWIGSGSSSLDTVKYFTGGVTGQRLSIVAVDDSVVFGNLYGTNNDLFLYDGTHRAASGEILEFIKEDDSWRQINQFRDVVYGGRRITATNTAITISTVSTWTRISGTSSWTAQNITSAADSFTVKVAGDYKISVTGAIFGVAASTDNFKISVAKNSAVAGTYLGTSVTTADATTYVNFAFNTILTGLVGGDDISLYIQNTSDADDPTLRDLTWIIEKL